MGDALEEEDAELAGEAEEPAVERRILKQTGRFNAYRTCMRAGLASLAAQFGLTPNEFAHIVRMQVLDDQVRQCPTDPQDLARKFISSYVFFPLSLFPSLGLLGCWIFG